MNQPCSPSNGQWNIRELHQNGQGEWRIELSDGPQVLLGAQQLNERMHRFLLVHRRVLKSSAVAAEYVDVRYANGLAVRYKEPVPDGEAEKPLLVAHNNKTDVGVEGIRGNR